jgi:hypothetical protein
MVMSITPAGKVSETIAATPLAWEWASTCQRITHASTVSNRVARQASPARRVPTRTANTATGAAQGGASNGAEPARAGHGSVRARHAWTVAARPATGEE